MKMAEATTTGGVALPYNLEAEQSVLGCILLNSGCMEEVLMHLKAENFYLPQHRAIFGAMLSMYTSSQANIDPVLIADVLAKRDITMWQAAGNTWCSWQTVCPLRPM